MLSKNVQNDCWTCNLVDAMWMNDHGHKHCVFCGVFIIKAIQCFTSRSSSRKCCVSISRNSVKLWYGCRRVNSKKWGRYQWGNIKMDYIPQWFLLGTHAYLGNLNPAWEYTERLLQENIIVSRIITLTVVSSDYILCLCLSQDYCGAGQSNGSFRIITENVLCGTTGTTCSKSIKIFLGVNTTHSYCPYVLLQTHLLLFYDW